MHAAADVARFHFFHEFGTYNTFWQDNLEHVPVGPFKIFYWQLHPGFLLEFGAEYSKVMSGERMATRGDGVKLRQLVQADGGGDVGHVELASQHIHFHAVESAARDAL